MKLLTQNEAGSKPQFMTGFTLVDVMVAMVIFTILFIGIMVSVQIFGLRVYTMGATKLSATAGALKVLNQIQDDIRSANMVFVGNLTTSSSAATFYLTGTNNNAGSALLICTTTNVVATTYVPPYTIYYLDTNSTPGTNTLKYTSTTDGTTFTTPVILASYITNTIVFDQEDYMGNIQTNDSYLNPNNRIIRMELDFYQWEYPLGYIGGTAANAYDFYRLTTKVTRRQID
jgi:type II secretory pathway pseudopilin PulG